MLQTVALHSNVQLISTYQIWHWKQSKHCSPNRLLDSVCRHILQYAWCLFLRSGSKLLKNIPAIPIHVAFLMHYRKSRINRKPEPFEECQTYLISETFFFFFFSNCMFSQKTWVSICKSFLLRLGEPKQLHKWKLIIFSFGCFTSFSKLFVCSYSTA